MIELPLAAVAIWVGAMNVGFRRAKANPDVGSIVQGGSSIAQAGLKAKALAEGPFFNAADASAKTNGQR